MTIINTTNAILAVCNQVAKHGPETFTPRDPFTGQVVTSLEIHVPKYPTWEDMGYIQFLKEHPRPGVIIHDTKS